MSFSLQVDTYSPIKRFVKNLAHRNWSPRSWLAAFVVAAALAVPANAMALGFVISEVLFEDSSGADDNNQWIELFNGTGSDIDLSTFSLGWGRKDYTRGTLQLSDYLLPAQTMLTSGSTFVIGGLNSGADNGNPVYDIAYNFNKTLQKGDTKNADGIALFEMDAVDITATSVPYFTVIYGKVGTKIKLWVTSGAKATNATIESAFAPGESIQIDGASIWQVASTPGPGTLSSPEPGTAVLLGAGLAGLAISGRRRRVS